jgi:Skp family chaperone for outer membrane proteins
MMLTHSCTFGSFGTFQALKTKHADEIAALQTSHEEKYRTLMQDARKESDAAHSAELASLRQEMTKAVEQLKAVHAVEIQSVHESGESIIATIKGEFGS